MTKGSAVDCLGAIKEFVENVVKAFEKARTQDDYTLAN